MNSGTTTFLVSPLRCNRVLGSMKRTDLELIEGQLEPVELKVRQRLEVANRPIAYAYFVGAGIASVVAAGPGGGAQQRWA